MSRLKTSVGQWKLDWKTAPRGHEGVACVEVNSGELLEVRWRRDLDGFWILLPHGIFGFDLQSERDDSGRAIYHVWQRNSNLEWQAVESTYGGYPAVPLEVGVKIKKNRIKAQMPGKIIRIWVKPGQLVDKDQSVGVMEAMKMENEIRAPYSGKISEVKVIEGQTVETGADLILMENAPV